MKTLSFFIMAIFEISKPGQTLDDIANRANGASPEFANKGVTVTTTTKTPVAPTQKTTKERLAEKSTNAKEKEKTRTGRLEEALEGIDDLLEEQLNATNTNAVYGTLVNTPLRDLVDLSAIDLTAILPVEKFSFSLLGLPTPDSANLTLSDLVSLDNVDLRQAPLPVVRFGKLIGTHWVLSDIITELNYLLTDIDLRHAVLPTLDYSAAVFDPWVFPDGVDRNAVPLRHVVDLSKLDLSTVIDTSGINVPDIIDGESPSSPVYIDVTSYLDDLKESAREMGNDGDLFSLTRLYEKLVATNVLGDALVTSILKPYIISAMVNFNVPGYEGNVHLPKDVKDKVTNAFTVLPDVLRHGSLPESYNNDVIRRIHPQIINAFKGDVEFDTIAMIHANNEVIL